jgi:thymidylate synthase (FAD)
LSHIYQEFCFYLYAWKERKIKNDVIKYALPEGYPTQFVWSINLRSLKNFLNLRDSKSAHQEIANVARLIKESLKDTYIFELI